MTDTTTRRVRALLLRGYREAHGLDNDVDCVDCDRPLDRDRAEWVDRHGERVPVCPDGCSRALGAPDGEEKA